MGPGTPTTPEQCSFSSVFRVPLRVSAPEWTQLPGGLWPNDYPNIKISLTSGWGAAVFPTLC